MKTIEPCPLCKTKCEVYSIAPLNQLFTINCPSCGKYNLTDVAAHVLDKRKDSFHIISGITRNFCELHKDTDSLFVIKEGMIDDDVKFQAEFISKAPKSENAKALLLLQYICRKSNYRGDKVLVNPSQDYPIFFCKNAKEMIFYINHVRDSGDIKAEGTMKDYTLSLTIRGWQQVESLNMKDTVSVLKKNGEEIDGIKASVQKRKIFIDRSDVLIEAGDRIQRKMSNGGEETYEVIDPGYYERHGSISAHYEMDVKKLGLAEAKERTRHVDSLAKDSQNLESVDIPETQNMIKLFISHSSKDEALVKELIQLVKNALGLSSTEIRCTSIDGYRLPGGANTNEQIRREVHDSKAFIGLISFAAMDSMYLLFELGARWGSDKHLLPLLAPGVSPDILEEPLSGLNALSCSNASKLHQLVNDLAEKLGITPEPPAAYQRYIEAILAIPPSEDKTLSAGDQPDLQFDQRLGIFISKTTGASYCTKCHYSSPSKEVQLQVQRHGWRCHACGEFYRNPDYKRPTPRAPSVC